MSRKIFIFICGIILYLFITLNYPILDIVIKQAKAENSTFNELRCADLLLSYTIKAHNWNVQALKSPPVKVKESETATQKNFIITYTVKPTDTLWKISQKYGTNPSVIRKLNKLKGDILKVGMKLKIETKKS